MKWLAYLLKAYYYEESFHMMRPGLCTVQWQVTVMNKWDVVFGRTGKVCGRQTFPEDEVRCQAVLQAWNKVSIFS
jgi:hypothetical protein